MTTRTAYKNHFGDLDAATKCVNVMYAELLSVAIKLFWKIYSRTYSPLASRSTHFGHESIHLRLYIL